MIEAWFRGVLELYDKLVIYLDVVSQLLFEKFHGRYLAWDVMDNFLSLCLSCLGIELLFLTVQPNEVLNIVLISILLSVSINCDIWAISMVVDQTWSYCHQRLKYGTTPPFTHDFIFVIVSPVVDTGLIFQLFLVYKRFFLICMGFSIAFLLSTIIFKSQLQQFVPFV